MQRRVLLAVGLVLIAVITAAIIRGTSHKSQSAQASGGKGGRNQQEGGPVAVTLAKVTKEDVPIYLQGVGTVQAYQTVTVHSRVDGQLDRVAFKEGQDVKVGDLLAQIDPRPFQAALEQAEAKKISDQAGLVNAQKDLERYKVLVQRHLQQEQTLDAQEAMVRQLEASVKGDEAAVDSAKVQLGYTHIAAPIPGRTGIRLVDTGNIVHASDANGIVVLTQVQPIAVVFTVPEQNVGAVSVAQSKDPLQVDALGPDGQTILDKGRLLLVDNQIDATTGTVRLKAVFPNEDRRLWPGQFVNGRLLLSTREDATVVPSPAIQRGPEGTFVYVAQRTDNTAQTRQVKVGQIQAGKAIIEQGLQEGEEVVVDGQYKLQPGSKISPQQPAASGAGGGDRRSAASVQARESQAQGRDRL